MAAHSNVRAARTRPDRRACRRRISRCPSIAMASSSSAPEQATSSARRVSRTPSLLDEPRGRAAWPASRAGRIRTDARPAEAHGRARGARLSAADVVEHQVRQRASKLACGNSSAVASARRTSARAPNPGEGARWRARPSPGRSRSGSCISNDDRRTASAIASSPPPTSRTSSGRRPRQGALRQSAASKRDIAGISHPRGPGADYDSLSRLASNSP